MQKAGRFAYDAAGATAEFFGTAGDMGFFDHVCSIVQDERKRCFKAGFLAGARAGTADLAAFNAEKEFDKSQITTNQISAERSFHEWRD